MFFRSYFDSRLAQMSYVVGCQKTGEAIVVDPGRQIEVYQEIAKAEGLHLSGIAETHIHADYVSGAHEMAEKLGVHLYVSDEGGPDWKYEYVKDYPHTLLKDGDQFKVGNIRFDVMHTPGHTPESISFVLTDEGGGSRVPMGIFTGDFVFVGDIGRPDLLEKAAKVEGTAESGAKDMFASLKRFKELPDYLQVWPAHGAGSACGKSLGAVPMSTVGYEKINNWALQDMSEADFVTQLLEGQPEPPTYFARMKRVNKEGVDLRRDPEALAKFTGEDLGRAKVLVDVRKAKDFRKSHAKGALNIPLNKSISTWSGWLLDGANDVVLIGSEADAKEAMRALQTVGVDDVIGYAETEAAITKYGSDSYEEISPEALAPLLEKDEAVLIDVRNQTEWEEGHIEGARHLMLGHLEDRLDEVGKERLIVMQCQSGARSAIAMSVMQRAGFDNVKNLTGGFSGWQKKQLPVTS